jgi:hypothetical protein
MLRGLMNFSKKITNGVFAALVNDGRAIPPLARSFQAPEWKRGREAGANDKQPGSEHEQGGIDSAAGGE